MHCDHCETELDVSGYPPGSRGKCPECGAILLVPDRPAPTPVRREVEREAQRAPEPERATALPHEAEPEPEPEAQDEPVTVTGAAAATGNDEMPADDEPGSRQALWLGAIILVVGLVIVAAALNYFFGGQRGTPADVATTADTATVPTAAALSMAVPAPAPDRAVVADPVAPAVPAAVTAAPARPTPAPAPAAVTTPPAAPRPTVAAPTAAPRPVVTTPAVTTPATPSARTIRVKILNATGVTGLAAEVERKMEAANPNIRVISVGTHDGAAVRTMVYDKHHIANAPQTVQQVLGIGQVTDNPDNQHQYEYDVLVVLGTDYLSRRNQ